MTLECVMIMIDNSVFARNGDCHPSRLQAQLDSASSIISFKTNQNIESYVGMMAMAGSSPQILTTPINEPSLLYSLYGKVKINGKMSLVKSLQVAQLALKHRVNKKQNERIVVFIASEIQESAEELFVVARNLRRNSTAVDIINICNDQNAQTLRQFHEIVNTDENSHLVLYQGGTSLLSDAIKASGILGLAQQAGQGGFQEEVDPELEMVLRISLEEARKQQEELEARQRRDQQAASQVMEVEQPSENDDEKERLLAKAQDILAEDTKQKAGKEAKPENEYIKDPEFIKEILNDLKIDPKDGQPQQKKEDPKK